MKGKVSRGDGKGRRKVKATKDSEASRAARTNTKSVTSQSVECLEIQLLQL